MTAPQETEQEPGLPLEDEIAIAAPTATVWALVHDVRRMADWSPQVDSVELLGSEAIGLGTRFANHNIAPDPDGKTMTWTTHGEVVRWEEGRELAFRIDENTVVWSFVLEPLAAGGTTLVQRRETPEGLSELSRQLTDAFMGGQQAFTRTLRGGMRETLERIKAAAEA